MTQKSQTIQSEKHVLPKMVCEAVFTLTPQQADEADQKPKGLIKATATTFGPRTTEDGRKFFYTKESFATWADEMNKGGFQDRPLPMFLNHMSEMLPAGEWNHVECNEESMEISGQIYTNTTFGMDMMAILMRNPMMLPAVSISAYANQSRMVDDRGMEVPDGMEGDAYFQITDGGLREVSVVMHPANPRAEIKTVEKFLGNEANPRYIEKVLREAGLKKDEAVMVTSVLKKEQLLRDAIVPKDIAEEASDLLKSNETAILEALKHKQLLDRLKKWK